jgi:CPA2 family monovalent cation:H+ antiporter-2
MADATLLTQGAVAIALLSVAGLLADRLGQSVIPAYIVVGVVIGPFGPVVEGVSLRVIENPEFVDLLSELGIVLLLFFLGLEFHVDQLVDRRDAVVAAGVVDFAVNFGLGFGLGVLFSFTLLESLFVGGIVYISSSAVITKSLLDLGWIADPESEAILGVLVFEDILIAVYLAILTAVALGGGGTVGVATDVGVAAGFLGVLFLVARYGGSYVDRLFRAATDELFLLRVLGATTLVAAGALALGVSEAVAAFFVGTALAETGHMERVERVLSPPRDLFAALFFFAIGLETNVGALSGVLDLLVVAVVVSVLGKFASGVVGGRRYGLDDRRAFRVGVGLVPRGEFSLVLAALAARAGAQMGGETALAETIPAFAVGYVLVMSVVGTTAMRYADVIAKPLGFADAG